MTLSFAIATDDDAPAITSLRNAVAEELTRQFGQGHWSSAVTEQGVRRGIETSRVLTAREGGAIVGTLRLATKKPWAVDRAYFSDVKRPLYLLDMAVDPRRQRRGVGRQLLDEAKNIARAWPGQAICLDAYDNPAGAGPFYGKCGYREVGRVTYRGVPLVYFELLL